MRLYSYFRDRCRLRDVRKARIRRAEHAQELWNRCERNRKTDTSDCFRRTNDRLRELKKQYACLAHDCEGVKDANLRNRHAPCHAIEKRLSQLEDQYLKITAQDKQWSQTTEQRTKEFSLLVQEGLTYERSVHERIQYFKRHMDSLLERAGKLKDPDLELGRAYTIIQNARRELEIPRRALLRTRSLPETTLNILDMGLAIHEVHADSTTLKALVEAANTHCLEGAYAQADNESMAAEKLAERIREAISGLVTDARDAQRGWLILAKSLPDFGLQFRSSIEQVMLVTDPQLMLPEWNQLCAKIGSFALTTACAMGNAEQNFLMSELGGIHVQWKDRLNHKELLDFAWASSDSHVQLEVGADEPPVPEQDPKRRYDERLLPSCYLPKPG